MRHPSSVAVTSIERQPASERTIPEAELEITGYYSLSQSLSTQIAVPRSVADAGPTSTYPKSALQRITTEHETGASTPDSVSNGPRQQSATERRLQAELTELLDRVRALLTWQPADAVGMCSRMLTLNNFPIASWHFFIESMLSR